MSLADTSLERAKLAGPSRLIEPFRSPAVLIRECLAGAVTALALVPEVVSFSFVSGVDPRASLLASVVMGLTMSILGGRPAMVTAAAGSVALVLGPLVHAQGLAYVFPTVLLAGAIQIAFGLAGLPRVMRFVPRSVMTGFVNALGVLIFVAQTPHVLHATPLVYPLFALTVAIVLVLPWITTAIPAPLVAIAVATAIVALGHFDVPRVGDATAGAGALPSPGFFAAPRDLHTLAIIWPTAISVAFVGLLETLLTAKLVDEMTDTRSHKGRESWGLGVANILAVLLGGTAGCAMIGQTVVNVKLGGARTRVSTAAAALVLLALLTVSSRLMAQIPMVALAAVMMVVAVKTFDWRSVSPNVLKRMPLSETAVTAATVLLTIATGNLALGVGVGVLLAMLFFARRAAQIVHADRVLSDDGESVRYDVRGPLFFGSVDALLGRFAFPQDPPHVTIDLSRSGVWDASSVAALDAVAAKYRARGASVELVGLDDRSLEFHGRLTGQI